MTTGNEALAISADLAQVVADRIRVAAMTGITDNEGALAMNEHAAVCWETYSKLLKDAAHDPG